MANASLAELDTQRIIATNLEFIESGAPHWNRTLLRFGRCSTIFEQGSRENLKTENPKLETVYESKPTNTKQRQPSEDKKLQRALEKWLPNYLDWWQQMGPNGFQEKDVYLRTAISVEPMAGPTSIS